MKESLIREQIGKELKDTDYPELGEKYSGKIRDNYTRDGRRVIITTDKVSAFDVVLGTIPFKGQVLNQMARFWLEKTKEIVRNHMVSCPDPSVMIVEECKALPVEMVVRAYITGVTKTSAWYNYQQGVRNFCGNLLPEGLRKDQKLERPILTPSTKAEKGGHDESVSPDEVVKRGLISRDLMDRLSEISFRLFDLGSRLVAKQGMILVDTKYEFGLDPEGRIVLIDEIHTPDSSRFWYQGTYRQLFDSGQEQKKIDKEFVRKWYADQGYRGDGKPPAMPESLKVEAAKRYIEAYEQVTGQKFIPDPSPNPAERIRENLRKAGLL